MIHCMIGKTLLNFPETGQCFLFRLEGSPADNCGQIDFHFVMAGVAVVLQQNRNTWATYGPYFGQRSSFGPYYDT